MRGVTLPGMPGVLLGHNERIAWGSTALMADAQDLFVEELDETGERYRFRGDWLDVRQWEEEIHVRDAPPVRIRVRLTHHGPLVRSRGRWGLALRWERLDTPPGDPTFHALNVARNWHEFRAALASYSLPPTDFTYADVDGRIGAQSAGCVPRRAAGDGMLPAPARDGRYEWLGYVPFDELPSIFVRPSTSSSAPTRTTTAAAAAICCRGDGTRRTVRDEYRRCSGSATITTSSRSRESSTIARPRTRRSSRSVWSPRPKTRAAAIPCGRSLADCSPGGMGGCHQTAPRRRSRKSARRS